MILAFWQAYLITVGLETPVVWWLLGKPGKLQMVLASILVNSVTLPCVWFVLPGLFTNYWAYWFSAEALVVASEAVLYGALLGLWNRSLAASFWANALTALLGLFIGFLL